jgi:hypothetical protein
LSKGTCRNFEEIPLTWLLTIRKSLSSTRQVQALGGAFGVKYPLPLQTSCDYDVLFDDNLNVYVETEERLLVTHAVEQEGVTVDNFIHGRRNSNVSTWIKLSVRFKTFFKPWQIVYVDTSGKWRSKSSHSNHYHTVFACARSGFKLTFPHKKKISIQKFDSLLLAKGCQHISLPKSKHYSHKLGVPEKVIGDLNRNTRAVMTDVNIPPMYWDIVV